MITFTEKYSKAVELATREALGLLNHVEIGALNKKGGFERLVADETNIRKLLPQYESDSKKIWSACLSK